MALYINIGYTVPTFHQACTQYIVCYITGTEDLFIYTSALAFHSVHVEQKQQKIWQA